MWLNIILSLHEYRKIKVFVLHIHVKFTYFSRLYWIELWITQSVTSAAQYVGKLPFEGPCGLDEVWTALKSLLVCRSRQLDAAKDINKQGVMTNSNTDEEQKWLENRQREEMKSKRHMRTEPQNNTRNGVL